MNGHRQDPNPYPHHQDQSSSYHPPPPPPPPPPHHQSPPDPNSAPHSRPGPNSPYPQEHNSPYYPRQDGPPYPPHPQDHSPYHAPPPHPQDHNSPYSRRPEPPPGQHWPPPPAHHQAPSGPPPPPGSQQNGYHPSQSGPPPPPSAHTNGYHPSHPAPPTTLPPLNEHRPDMAMHAPPHPQYRGLPGPHEYYQRGPPPHPDYRSPHMYAQAPQPAPRQRTAIACRYCRRRKIRCSGFESDDGRCTNCTRFSQECIFTPVASQAQAFVPAHTVYNRGGAANGHIQYYGAYGQPVRPEDVPYASRPGPYPPAALPPPNQPSYGPPPHYPPPYEAPNGIAGRRRPASDDLPDPRLPPLNPATSSNLPRTLAPELNGHEYRYPDPATAGGPPRSPPAGNGPYRHPPPPPPPHTASSHPASVHTSAPQPAPYYHSQPPPAHRVSPGGTSYATDGSRASASPNTLATASTPGTDYVVAPPSGYSNSDQHRTVNSLDSKEHTDARIDTKSTVTNLPAPASSTQSALNALALQGPPRTQTPSGTNPGRNSPTSHSVNGGQHSPTSAQASDRPGLSIRSIVSDGPRASSDIDSGMLARLGKP